MRSFARTTTATAGAIVAARRHFSHVNAMANGTQDLTSVSEYNRAVLNTKTTLKTASAAAASTGSFVGHHYSEEDIFCGRASASAAAKAEYEYAGNHQSFYVVPEVKTELAANANVTLKRLADDADHVELLFRKFIRTYPATTPIFGTPEEIAAFEATEAAKIPNNKLIVGRVNAKVSPTNIRAQMLELFVTLGDLAAAGESEAAVKAYAVPILEKFLVESFLGTHYLWFFYDEVMRSVETLPEPATPYERRALAATLERQIKIALNGCAAEFPWASEALFCPVRGTVVAPNRIATEAGMW